MLRIAVPNKGRLREPAIRLLKDAGFEVADERQQLLAMIPGQEVELVFVRAQDIPGLVERGAADLGITGRDLVLESGAEVEEVLDLGFGSARVVVAAHEGSGIRAVGDIKPGARVATEFPNIAGRYFEERGLKVRLVRVSGAAEITPIVGMADLIVDLTSTGASLQAHGLRIIDTLLETSARLIANRQSLAGKREEVEGVVTALSSVIQARGRKLVVMNVPEAKLPVIKQIMPGMAGPTVSRVEAAEPMLAVQAVVRADEVYEVVRRAKQAGARDVLVLPIERLLP